MKNLDLSFFNSTCWSVTMPNGVEIEVRKPTQKVLRLLEERIEDVEKEKNATAQLEKLVALTKILLSNNHNDVVVDNDLLDSLTVDMLYAIYFGYMEFVNELVTTPN